MGMEPKNLLKQNPYNLLKRPKDKALQVSIGQSIVKLAINLFSTWELSIGDQLHLLGLSPTDQERLMDFRNGTAIPSKEMRERVGLLLSIHKSLRLLYPYDQKFRYQWVTKRNNTLNNLRPLDVMKEEGLVGIATIARHLDFLRGQ